MAVSALPAEQPARTVRSARPNDAMAWGRRCLQLLNFVLVEQQRRQKTNNSKETPMTSHQALAFHFRKETLDVKAMNAYKHMNRSQASTTKQGEIQKTHQLELRTFEERLNQRTGIKQRKS